MQIPKMQYLLLWFALLTTIDLDLASSEKFVDLRFAQNY